MWGTRRASGFARTCLRFGRSKRVHPAIRRRLLRQAERAIDIVDVHFQGVRLRCHTRDNTTDHDVVFGGKFDNRRELDELVKHLRPGDIFVDVGANSGLFSLAVAPRCSRVIAFEPNPVMAERMRFNVEANGFSNIEVRQVAVGDAGGELEIQVCRDELGQSSAVVPQTGPRIKVPMQPLTAIEVPRIDVLKVDVEGFEDRAISPLLQPLGRKWLPRVLMLETCHAHFWRIGVVCALQDAGYRIAWQSATDLLLTNQTAYSAATVG